MENEMTVYTVTKRQCDYDGYSYCIAVCSSRKKAKKVILEDMKAEVEYYQRILDAQKNHRCKKYESKRVDKDEYRLYTKRNNLESIELYDKRWCIVHEYYSYRIDEFTLI